MNKTFFAATLCLAGLLAQADQVSYSGTANTSVPGSVAVNVQQFDSTLGTLTGVTLSIVTGSESASLNLVNSGAADTWQVNLGNGTITFGDSTHTTVAYLSYMVDHNVAADSTTTITPSTPSGSSSQSYGALANYIGTGYVSDMTVAFTGFWGVDNLGGLDSFGVNSFTGTASWSVTYTYTPVPEASALSLFALGLAATGLTRRPKKTA